VTSLEHARQKRAKAGHGTVDVLVNMVKARFENGDVTNAIEVLWLAWMIGSDEPPLLDMVKQMHTKMRRQVIEARSQAVKAGAGGTEGFWAGEALWQQADREAVTSLLQSIRTLQQAVEHYKKLIATAKRRQVIETPGALGQ
jgi:hypothetical protein